MKYLFDFGDFLNEGAYLTGPNSIVSLNYNNDNNNDDEVLKTNHHGREFLDKANSEWPVYWSLSVAGYRGKVDHEGRFKYTMDQLKAGNIEGGTDSLSKFLIESFKSLKLIDKEIKYIIATGSTYGLVGEMATILQSVFNAKIIKLNKTEYLNAGDAVDWIEYQSQVLRQSKDGVQAKSFEGFKKMLVNTYVDKSQTEKSVILQLRSAPDVESLKDLVLNSEIGWREKDIDGKSLIPFIVRSSGRNFGGYRKMWKPKYQYSNSDFYGAVIDCATSRSKMLIIDDNQNTGEDFKNIKANIEKLISEYKKDKELQSDNKVISNYPNNFFFYVLYQMQHKEDRGTFYYSTKGAKTMTQFSVNSEIVNDFKNFIRNEEGYKSDLANISAKKEEINKLNVSKIGVDLFNLLNVYSKIESNKGQLSPGDIRNVAYLKAVKKISMDYGINPDKVESYYKKYLKQVNLHLDPAYNLTIKR